MSKLRVTGGILIGFGVPLAGIAALAMAGFMPLNINFFGAQLDTHGERVAWVIAWLLAVIIGIVLLRIRPMKSET